jgi:hypothetical protein
MTTIHAATAAEPKTIDFLSQKKSRDRLTVSGAFVERWGAFQSRGSREAAQCGYE